MYKWWCFSFVCFVITFFLDDLSLPVSFSHGIRVASYAFRGQLADWRGTKRDQGRNNFLVYFSTCNLSRFFSRRRSCFGFAVVRARQWRFQLTSWHLCPVRKVYASPSPFCTPLLSPYPSIPQNPWAPPNRLIKGAFCLCLHAANRRSYGV